MANKERERDRDKKITPKKPQFVKCDSLKPGTSGHNIVLKVASCNVVVEKNRSDGSKIRIAEALVGDDTASLILTARNDQIDVVQPGNTIEARNAKIEMFKGFMRLAVDKWGKVVKAASAATFEVNKANNLSNVEYELVPVRDDE